MSEDYKKLIKTIGEKNFDSRFKELQKQISEFLDEAGYDENVQCNDRILYHVLLDHYSDICRLKDFHGIENIKTDKVMAYLVFWLLRRKPIQLIEFSDEEKDIFVNERFASYLMISESIIKLDSMEIATKLNKEELEQFGKYLDLLLYYFKYRQVNPQMIELVIESFKIGLPIFSK